MTMREKILAEAVRQALRLGYTNIRRDGIADALQIAAGGVSYHWGHMDKLRAAVVRTAIENRQHTIIAQAVMARHPLALKLPDAQRRHALMHAAR